MGLARCLIQMCALHAKPGIVEGGKLRKLRWCQGRGDPATTLLALRRMHSELIASAHSFLEVQPPQNAVGGRSCRSMGCRGQEQVLEVESSPSANVVKAHSLHSAFTVHEASTSTLPSLPPSWGWPERGQLCPFTEGFVFSHSRVRIPRTLGS